MGKRQAKDPACAELHGTSRQQVAVIGGGNLASALAAKAATTAIPILFAVAEDRSGSDLLPALHRRTAT